MRTAALLFRSLDFKIDPESPSIKNPQFASGEIKIFKNITQNFCGLIEIPFITEKT